MIYRPTSSIASLSSTVLTLSSRTLCSPLSKATESFYSGRKYSPSNWHTLPFDLIGTTFLFLCGRTSLTYTIHPLFGSSPSPSVVGIWTTVPNKHTLLRVANNTSNQALRWVSLYLPVFLRLLERQQSFLF